MDGMGWPLPKLGGLPGFYAHWDREETCTVPSMKARPPHPLPGELLYTPKGITSILLLHAGSTLGHGASAHGPALGPRSRQEQPSAFQGRDFPALAEAGLSTQ